MEVTCSLPYDRVCITGIRLSFWTEYSNPEENTPFLVISHLVSDAGVASLSNPII